MIFFILGGGQGGGGGSKFYFDILTKNPNLRKKLSRRGRGVGGE